MTRKEKLARAAAVGADLALGAAPGAGAPSAGASSAGVLSASFEPDRLNILPISYALSLLLQLLPVPIQVLDRSGAYLTKSDADMSWDVLQCDEAFHVLTIKKQHNIA